MERHNNLYGLIYDLMIGYFWTYNHHIPLTQVNVRFWGLYSKPNDINYINQQLGLTWKAKIKSKTGFVNPQLARKTSTWSHRNRRITANQRHRRRMRGATSQQKLIRSKDISTIWNRFHKMQRPKPVKALAKGAFRSTSWDWGRRWIISSTAQTGSRTYSQWYIHKLHLYP